MEKRKIFYRRCKKFGIDKIIKDVAFSDEMPARLHGCFNRNNLGFRDFKENKPTFVQFKNKSVSIHTWGFISGRGSSELYFFDGSVRINSKKIRKSSFICEKTNGRFGC